MNRVVFDSQPNMTTLAEKKPAPTQDGDEPIEKPLPSLTNFDNSADYEEYYKPASKTDFTLQQQMMGIGRCKDLDEWLVGSGESAETADSKKPVIGILASQLQSSSLEGADPNSTAKYGNGGAEIETMDIEGSGGKIEADWMFQTFDQ